MAFSNVRALKCPGLCNLRRAKSNSWLNNAQNLFIMILYELCARYNAIGFEELTKMEEPRTARTVRKTTKQLRLALTTLKMDKSIGQRTGRETAELGDDVLLYQGVTLGGTGKDVGKRHPTIGNNVMIGSGAKVLGPFTVGDNSRIASNAVVLSAIPSDSTAVGVPAKVVRIAGVKVNFAAEVDQISVTDPVEEEIESLRREVEKLKEQLKGDNQ